MYDEISIAMCQTQGRQYRGQTLTAGHLRNSDIVRQMIRSDDAYKFLKNVRGSPAYFQQVMYEVLGMIRQLGLPTWFLTQSAADMQWPDVIQTIARQYGTIISDDDVKGMSFEDKSKWLRQNPVTAAYHFHYWLQTFFQTFLKSCAQPIGELVDYAIRIEFQARASSTPTQYCGLRTHPSWTKTLMRRCAASLTAMCGVTSQRTMKTLLIWCRGYNDTSTLPPVEGRASADFTTLVPPARTL